MSNLVLYRKYRPQRFSEIVGQSHVVRTITNALLQNAVAHAYLFSGPRGTGKTTIARILAKAVNCLERKDGESEPCNNCFACKEITSGRAMDIFEIDAASNRGIDEIRALKESLRVAPSVLRRKVYIIDETHMLTREAFNALLKSLEEPPADTIFVLATTEIQKIPATIISRVQRFDFKKFNLPEITSRLELLAKKEGVNIEKPAVELIAVNAQGSIRDAESLLGQVMAYQDKDITAQEVKDILGLTDARASMDLIVAVAHKNTGEAIAHINQIYESGYDLSQFCKGLLNHFRYILLIKIDRGLVDQKLCGFSDEELSQLCALAENFDEARLMKTMRLFIDAQNSIKQSPIPQLPLEIAAAEAIAIA